jgi:hypothetical protein
MLTAGLGINYLNSNLAGIALGTIWNYWINANVTWGILIPPKVNETDDISFEISELGNNEVPREERNKV